MAQIGLLEDNARIAKLCATLLDYAGHQVTLYKHPDECLQALLPAQVAYDHFAPTYAAPAVLALPIDVLILDLYMPGISGIEVLQKLRAHPQTHTLPLILCTAATPAEIARALNLAPQAIVVEKPFKLQTLTSAITTSLRLS
ncbi:MAG: response regulator [Ktedonobacteraceae bacterium]|nr:response regulator [Ktedonobacteraceae bacterium]